jgi:hypothetical protein
LPILKYDANQEALVEQIEGALMEEEKKNLVEEEKEPKTPLQLTSKEGENTKNTKNTNKECCGSNYHVNIESWHQQECRSPLYVCYYKHTSK